MELQAAVIAFEYIVNNSILPADVVLRLDSKYVLDGLQTWSKGWVANSWKTSKNQPVKNCELWKQIVLLRDTVISNNGAIDYRYVKGHSGDTVNDLVDQLAVRARDTAKTVDAAWVDSPIIYP